MISSWWHDRRRHRTRMGRSKRQTTLRGITLSQVRASHALDHSKDRYAYGNFQPVVDNTTIDWFGLQGREENGWTAIQFRRALDTCDTMDVPIRVRSASLSL